MIYAQVPYRIEPELAGARPRRARFTAETQKRRFRTWAFTLAPLAALIICGLNSVEHDDAMLTRGKVTTARIVSKAVYDNGRSSNDPAQNDSSTNELAVIFKFRVNEIEVLGKGEVPIQEFPTIKPGDPFVVTYLPENPRSFVQGRVSRSHVEQKDADWIIGIALIGLALAVYIFITERYFWQRRQLLRAGQLATATVVGHHTAESGETATYFVRYEYYNSLHVKFEGNFGVSPKRARNYPDGSKLTILCKPDAREPGVPYVSITEADIVKA